MARVLVIEDEPAIALILREVLSEVGHEVFTATNGATGLTLIRKHPGPEIVLMDLFIPGISGRTIIESLRKDSRLKDIPVVVITGSMPGTKQFPPEGSYQACIYKPFDLDQVVKVVNSFFAAA